ncbi:MAG: HTTM domain-containing protein [Ilumatobacteraceae bacterium]
MPGSVTGPIARATPGADPAPAPVRGRAQDWMFAPAPASRLALFRVITGLFATVYLTIRVRAFAALADNDTSRFDPVGVLSWLDRPLTDGLWLAVLVATIATGVAFTAGAVYRLSGPAFAVLLLVVTTYRSSWGQLLHFENLLVLHVLIVGVARGADARSVDARIDGEAGSRAMTDESRYGWPLRLAATVTVLTYVLAGIAKLRYGGLGWVLGDSLRNHVAYSAVRLDLLGGTPSPFAEPLVGQASWIFPPVALITVLLELGAPVALLGGRIRTAWVGTAWLLHAAVAAVMFVVFPYPLFLVAFAPLFELERIEGWLDKFRRNRRSAAACKALRARPPRRP